ncbi:hypothetical protein HN51_059851, partial [Arachis hypogaea]
LAIYPESRLSSLAVSISIFHSLISPSLGVALLPTHSQPLSLSISASQLVSPSIPHASSCRCCLIPSPVMELVNRIVESVRKAWNNNMVCLAASFMVLV